MARRHFIALNDELWKKLWDEARNRKKPTKPAEIVREILNRYFKRKERRSKK